MVDEPFQIGPLAGGGLQLTYRCPSRCRHCLYGCGSHRTDGKPTNQELERVLDLLADIGPDARYHIGGGEPFLDVPLLKRAIEQMADRHLAVDYVETNAAWASSPEHAEQTLSDLARAGLKAILVSLSPFHAEFVPLRKTRMLIRAAQATLLHGALVWIPEFETDLAPCEDDQKLDLDAFLAERGDHYALSLARRYGLVPGGRAGPFLAHHGLLRFWRELARSAPCARRLRDTSHFHVDGQGRFVPGLCAGLVLPLEHLRQGVDLKSHPVVGTLLGPNGLLDLVTRAQEIGFEPKDLYSSACHLCTHIRQFLVQNAPTDDLGPEGFYDERSIPDLSQ